MTPFGKTVATELRAAVPSIETASIIDYRYLPSTIRALLNNALFYVVPTPAIDEARAHALAACETLAEAISEVGVRTQGISLTVDRARADAIVALEDLVDRAADAEPTQAARSLGVI